MSLIEIWHAHFPNTLVNCSLPLVFPHALLFLSPWHHAPVPNRPWHNENKKIKKQSGNKCDLWVPLKTVVCVCVYLRFFCVQYCSFWAYITACVLYTSPPMAGVEKLKLLTVMTGQSSSLIFHYFIVNTARDFRERNLLVLRKWKHRQAPGWKRNGRGWRMKRQNVPLHQTATMQLLSQMGVKRLWQTPGYSTDDWVSAYHAFSATFFLFFL